MRWLPLVVVCVPAVAVADRAVTGTVVDDRNGRAVAGALVSVGANDTGTDDAGTFRIDGLPFGRLDVVVIADGYQPYFGSARVGATLAIRLSPATSGGELIEVSGHAPSEPTVHLSTEDVKTLPGAGNDALRALQSMQGAARTPFGLGGLALRGTAPRDTKVYLDGIEVPLLYHFGGVASFLPTGAVDELQLEPGGASVRYGRGLGGVGIVTSRTGRGDRWRASGEVSLIHAAALAEGPAPLDGSWLVGVRRSYFDAIEAAAGLDLAIAPRYGDAQLRWESGDGHWMAIAFGSDDDVRLLRNPGDSSEGLDTSSVKSFSYAQRFMRVGVRYRAIKNAVRFEILPSVGLDDVDARANHKDQDKGLHRTTTPIALRTEVAAPLAGGTLSIGADAMIAHHWYDMINTPPPTIMDPSPQGVVHRSLERWAADAGAWLEQSWFFANDQIETRAGIRGDHFGLSDQWTLDPRLVVREHLRDDLELSQSIGRYHEPPLVTDLDPIFGMRRMLGSSATQVAASIKKIVGDDREATATVYYQDLRELPVDAVTGATPLSANGGTSSGGLFGISRELVDAQFGSYSYREAIGTGYAYGLELSARKALGWWTGWIAYTYARSYRKNPTLGDMDLPYVLDQPHALTVVASTALGRWRFGGRIRYVTGNPFTPVAGAYQKPASDEWVAVDGPLLSQRLPDFFQLDLRVDRTWKRPWGTLALYLDVQNVLNRENPEGVTYNNDYTRQSYTRGLPVFPSLGIEYLP